MNEIEYRLERTPPVNEDPEDAIFDDVPAAQQVSFSYYGEPRCYILNTAECGMFSCFSRRSRLG